MNATFDSFYAAYRDGQRFEWGEQPQLIEHLEGLGGGLPTDPGWRTGGPMLVDWRDGKQILGWMRGVPTEEIDRVNTWEAWGIIGPSGAFIDWPRFWEQLAARPQRETLDHLALRISRGEKGSGFPHVPTGLAPVLEQIHLSNGNHHRISMYEYDQLPLLAWCYLFGPVPPKQATVGPPRRFPIAKLDPFTYEGHVEDGGFAPDAPVRSAFLASIAAAAENGRIEEAFQAAVELRRLSPFEGRQRILAEPPRSVASTASPQKRKGIHEQEQPMKPHNPPPPQQPRMLIPPEIESALKHLRIGMIVGAGALLLVLLLAAVNLFQLQRITHALEIESLVGANNPGRPWPPGLAGTSTAATDSAAGDAQTTTAPAACAVWWTQPANQLAVLDAVRRKAATNRITFVAPARAVLAPSAVWDNVRSPKTLTDAAVQLQLANAQCLTGVIDGAAGPGTRTAEAACRQQGVQIATGDAALQWLCAWSSQP